ncbi:MAG: alanine racemase [Proteobacteria bacterium]|nr:MAG: alanine racemase [Pseudomonadota bacterium]
MHLFARCSFHMISSTGILTIDLSAIKSNWLYISALLRKGAVCAAAIKADAYGVGAVQVANALYSVGCRHFYVVTLHEAVELRNNLPDDIALYVLGGVPDEMEYVFVDLNLIPVLYSSLAVQRWMSFCGAQQHAFPCVLKLNTGMTRLGLDDSDLDMILSVSTDRTYLKPVIVMSHLACADEPSHPLNNEQLHRFNAALSKIKTFYPDIKSSLANSSGTLLDESYHFDMVRIGAALYGINPQTASPNPLKPAIHLKLPVLQIRTIEKPESVGYGATALVDKGIRLAVAAGGYADGTHRSLGSAPKGQVDGIEVKAIGRTSMDSCVFDLSTVEGDPLYIDVINNELTLDYLMNANKSLGYEVLTSLSRRYRRRYIFSGDNNE